MKKRANSDYEGRQEQVRRLKIPRMEVWENKYPDKEYMIKIETAEFTCICPKTGLPDFAEIKIRYIPDRHCIELKSLKYYFAFFRNIGIFHEHLINKMLDDFVAACKPRYAEIEGVFNPRGGITTTVVRIYEKK